MTTLRSRDDALCAGEEQGSLERLQLRDVHTAHQSVLDQLTDNRTSTMVTQSAGMDIGRLEAMTQRIHRQQRRIARGITEVVGEHSSRQFRTAGRLGSDKLGVLSFENLVAHKGESQSAEVAAATETGYHHVGIVVGKCHLLLCLQADDGLMERHMTQHRTQRILAVGSGHRQLDSLRDGRSERTGMCRVDGQNVFSCTGRHRGTPLDDSTKRTHHDAAVGLLLQTDLHLIDGSLQSEHLGSIAQGGSPLSGTRLCRHVGDALLLAVVTLRQSRVHLMRAKRVGALVLEVDMRRCVEGALQFVGADERCRTVVSVFLLHLLGDVYPLMGSV